MQRLELFGQSGNLLQSANNQKQVGTIAELRSFCSRGHLVFISHPAHKPLAGSKESAGDHAIPVGPVIKVYALGSSPDGFS